MTELSFAAMWTDRIAPVSYSLVLTVTSHPELHHNISQKHNPHTGNEHFT